MKKSTSFLYIPFNIGTVIFGATFIYCLLFSVYLLNLHGQLTLEISAFLLNSLLTGILSWLSQLLKNICYEQNRAHRLWKLRHPRESAICLSAHKWEQKLRDSGGTRIRYGVGEGQIKALPHVLTSLHQAYGDNYSWDQIHNSHSIQANAAYESNENLIIIGGPVTNPIAVKIIEDVKRRVNISALHNYQIDIEIPKHHVSISRTVAREEKEVDGVKPIITDYALILHITMQGNNRKRKVILLAGCNTYSTGAAAKFFCNQIHEEKRWQELRDSDYVAIIKCQVNGSDPSRLESSLDFIQTI